jgi:16S rRNA (cytosine1402-N4)-methyltransferase
VNGGRQLSSAYHAPVLVTEVTTFLRDAKRVLDGTLGGGGHSLALLEAGIPEVIGVDRDPDAIAAATERLHAFSDAGRFSAYQSNFVDTPHLHALDGKPIDGILLDLGISSHQIDDEARGFSFRPGAVLDMRMGRGGGDYNGGKSEMTAADFLNASDRDTLANAFLSYGDEKHARRLASEVVRRRETRPMATSDDFVGAIRAVLGPRSGAPDFARLFQAIRIAVNDELSSLERALPALRDRLLPGGMFVVIAYHSGEDRIVKNAFRDWSTACVCPPRQPVCTCRGHALGHVLTRRPVVPSGAEIASNVRARSARLRAWRKV